MVRTYRSMGISAYTETVGRRLWTFPVPEQCNPDTRTVYAQRCRDISTVREWFGKVDDMTVFERFCGQRTY